jgi:hypothetical protein
VLGVDGRVNGFKEIGWESVDWFHVAQNWDQWQVVINNTFYGSVLLIS